MDDDNNIIKFGQVRGGKTDEETIPTNEYFIQDKSGLTFYHTGFLLFTSQHLAIMQERVGHTVPVFLLPLSELAFCEIVDDDTEIEVG